ncbi:hypothetical protein FJY94_07720 [Candidatus Kaiserbacteria bacterium]|nr:hypothetical protein [Candidatus Kaiserbacteria bacterium]
MELNEELLRGAHELASQVEKEGLYLPEKIPGFPDLFLAREKDSSISAIFAIVSNTGNSYKIGTPR